MKLIVRIQALETRRSTYTKICPPTACSFSTTLLDEYWPTTLAKTFIRVDMHNNRSKVATERYPSSINKISVYRTIGHAPRYTRQFRSQLLYPHTSLDSKLSRSPSPGRPADALTQFYPRTSIGLLHSRCCTYGSSVVTQ
jgi:hypothetical protein